MSKPISTKKKYYECQCDKHKGKKLLIEDKFYSSNSPLFGSTHKVPICKSCISDMIDYNNINTINVAAINPTSVNIDDHIL